MENEDVEEVPAIVEDTNQELRDGMAGLYTALVEGNMDKINELTLLHYGHNLDGSEMMFADFQGKCSHCYLFESLSPMCPVAQWLSDGSCLCTLDDGEYYKAGFYPMHVAVIAKNYHLIDYLLSKGSSVNVQSINYELTPLHDFLCCCEEAEALPMTKSIHERGLDVMRVNSKGSSLVHVSAHKGHPEVLEFLLQNGALPLLKAENTVNENIPLILATRGRNLTCVSKLLEYGVDVNVTNSQGLTALYCAIRMGSSDIIKCLLDCDDIDVNKAPPRGFRSMVPLHYAIQQVDTDLVERLLQKGADPNARAESSLTPLMFATYMNTPDIARLLIKHQADVNCVNNQGYSPLHNAAWDGHEQLVRLFLSSDVKHDVRANDGNTALSLACHGYQQAIVELLLPLGCRVNNQDKDLDMPLHYATYNGCFDMVNALLQNGAKADVPNRLATTPLWNAAYKGRWKVIRLLLPHNPDLSIKSCGIKQHAQSEDVITCFNVPRSVIHAASRICSKFDDMNTLETLVAAGANLQQERWIYDEAKPEWLIENVHSWLLAQAFSPQTLLQLCRRLIRDMLRGWCYLPDQVHKMEIPHTLKAYILGQIL